MFRIERVVWNLKTSFRFCKHRFGDIFKLFWEGMLNFGRSLFNLFGMTLLTVLSVLFSIFVSGWMRSADKYVFKDKHQDIILKFNDITITLDKKFKIKKEDIYIHGTQKRLRIGKI